MENIVLGIIIINTILSIIIALRLFPEGQKAAIALFFCVFPVLGFAIYFIPLWILKIRGVGSYDRETLVRRLKVKRENVMPSVKKELNVIPIEDAMAISSNTEKRNLLLEQLKKDISANYKTVLVAGSDSDSESAHYVAAAKMEVYRRKQAVLLASKKEWEKDTHNPEKVLTYLESLSEYIDSDLLAEKEADIYKEEYCSRIYDFMQNNQDRLTAVEYGHCLQYLVELEQNQKVEEVWKNIPVNCKDENAYMIKLKMYYNAVDKEKFYQCLDELAMTDIKLSSEGLRMIRYWKERRV